MVGAMVDVIVTKLGEYIGKRWAECLCCNDWRLQPDQSRPKSSAPPSDTPKPEKVFSGCSSKIREKSSWRKEGGEGSRCSSRTGDDWQMNLGTQCHRGGPMVHCRYCICGHEPPCQVRDIKRLWVLIHVLGWLWGHMNHFMLENCPILFHFYLIFIFFFTPTLFLSSSSLNQFLPIIT